MTQQCVNCPGAEDHSTAQCPLVSAQKNELRQIITDALVSMVSGVTGLVPPAGPGQLPDFIQAPIDRAVEKISASLPVGVPDGYMPIPTAEHIADALENVRCFHDMSAELIAPRLLANLLASTTVKAEQADEAKRIDKQCRDDVAAALGFVSGGNFAWSYLLTQIKECVRVAEAPSLPAAGSADQQYPDGIADDLERSDWTPIEALQWYAAGKHFDVADGRTRIIDTGAVASNALKHASLAHLELKGDAELSELRAVLSAQQSAHVSVPREWLDAVKELFDAKQAKEDFERENPGNSTKRWDACLYRIEAAEDALSALLNGGEA